MRRSDKRSTNGTQSARRDLVGSIVVRKVGSAGRANDGNFRAPIVVLAGSISCLCRGLYLLGTNAPSPSSFGLFALGLVAPFSYCRRSQPLRASGCVRIRLR